MESVCKARMKTRYVGQNLWDAFSSSSCRARCKVTANEHPTKQLKNPCFVPFVLLPRWNACLPEHRAIPPSRSMTYLGLLLQALQLVMVQGHPLPQLCIHLHTALGRNLISLHTYRGFPSGAHKLGLFNQEQSQHKDRSQLHWVVWCCITLFSTLITLFARFPLSDLIQSMYPLKYLCGEQLKGDSQKNGMMKRGLCNRWFHSLRNKCGAIQGFFHLFKLELSDAKTLWLRGACSSHKTHVVTGAKKLTINIYLFIFLRKNNWYQRKKAGWEHSLLIIAVPFQRLV